MRYIVSVFSNKRSIENNLKLHKQFTKFLKERGFNFVEVQGIYKGIKELSFFVDFRQLSQQSVLDFARFYNQESILRLEANNKAYLVYTIDNVEEYIGIFSKIKEIETKDYDSLTYFPSTNAFYTAKKLGIDKEY